MWWISAAWALPLSPNTDLVAPPGDDAVCLPFAKAGRAVELPVDAVAGTIRVRWTVRGESGSGPAALVTLSYADGTTETRRAAVGETIGAKVPPGRATLPVLLGTDSAGKPVLGAEWTIEPGREVALHTLKIESRTTKGATVCVTSVDVGPGTVGATSGYPFSIPSLLAAPPPQAIPVEAPAGRHGKVRSGPDGHLWFEDGTRARFYGVNLQGQAAIPTKEDADAVAATLAAEGFNLVRLHHIDDGVGLVNPKRGEPGQPVLAPELADRLDFFISRLSAHGVYLFLETATLRDFTAADGVADPYGGHKLVGMWEPDWLAAHRKWIRDLWGRTNPYTKLRYADDPIVAVVELSNEHSLLASAGGGLEGLPLVHLGRLDTRWNEWLRARYGDDAKLTAAWQGGERPGLLSGETLGSVAREPKFAQLASLYPPQRRRDLYLFYAELEAAYYKALDEEIRALGFTAPVIPTLPYGRPDLHALQASWPVSDAHFEWDFPARKELVRNDSVLTFPAAAESPVEMFLGARAGTAVFVSEYNHPFPNRYAAEAPLVWATMGAIQDWDGLIWFNYNPGRKPEVVIDDFFDVGAVPTKRVQLATASSLFRGGWVDAAKGRLPLWYGAGLAVDEVVSGRNPLPYTLYEPSTLLSQQVRIDVSATPPAEVDATPVDGVGWWTRPGLFVVDRPMIQARVGPPEEPAGMGAGVTAPSRLRVKGQGWAAVALASADGQTLAQGHKALLTVATRTQNTGMLWSTDDRYVRNWGVGPPRVDPFVGTIDLKSESKPKVRQLGPDAQPGAELAVKSLGDGWWRLTLDATVACPWFLVER